MLLSAFAFFQLLSGSNVAAKSNQVLATVGKNEISLLQFNYLIKQIGLTHPNKQIKEEITDKLINREIAYQQALENKLEQSPDILLSIEEAKKDILARAYAEKIAAKISQPTENDIAHYFNTHPYLFSNRKIYHLNEISISADDKNFPAIKKYIHEKHNWDEFIAWSKATKTQFNLETAIRAAEQLPIETLPELDTASAGSIKFFESSRGLIIYQVLTSQTAPISFENSKNIIADYLVKQARKAAVDSDIAHLRRTRSVQIFPSVLFQKQE